LRQIEEADMSMQDEPLRKILRRQSVLPIMMVHSVDAGVRIAESLLAGGLDLMEIPLRTAECIGAGTLLRPEDFDRAEAAGAQFAISPGLDSPLAEAAARSRLPFLPGVQTASEVMTAIGFGFRTLKFYPARAAGGPGVLADFASIFPDVLFVPTGKVTQADVPEYLALRNVISVGGSWVAPADRVAAGDWPAITRLAQQAARMRKAVPSGDQ
jgi:2-dehydro-3-deoxyphosphogluconate aldolase/(4S)-4-hydroxy-2-oxoglutarate aldolase